MRSRTSLWTVGLVVLFAIAPASVAEGVAVRSAREFLDSIGVCTHIGQGADEPARAATALSYAGVRNIRDDGSPRHLQDWIEVHKQAGVKIVLTISGPNDAAIGRLIEMSRQLAGAGALLAMEGPNEPNNWAVTYQGEKSDGNKTFVPVAKWQAAFYAAVKADPVLKDFPVFHSSEAGGAEPENVGLQFLTIPSGAGTLMPDGTKYADYANVHNYICRKPAIIDNMAWINADPVFHGWTDGIYVEYRKTWRKGFVGYSNDDLAKLPRVTTETGWVTGGPKGLTQEQQGRLYLNLYIAQFKQGFKHTFVYMLRDAGGSDAGYGIVESDYKPKKSAEYLHNLTTILSDQGAARSAKLAYRIPDQPPTVHDLLLNKSNGTLDLVVWSEKASGSNSVVVDLEATHPSVKVYDPTIGTTPTQSLTNVRTIPLTLSDHPVVIEIPGSTIDAAPHASAAEKWSWQEPQAKVLPTGDLEWAPRPFEFKPGESIRYIDFDSGSDSNDGLSKQTPWKHHPWDPTATENAKTCAGPHTYVFKQGVDYRGELDARDSGTDAAPILLTRDPSWGTGSAVICGSERVTGWKKGADNALIPEHEKVWYVDLDWAPRNVWMVGTDGAVTRIKLARTPNWEITNPDDIKSEWWTWKNPDKPFDNYAMIDGQKRHLAFDHEHINSSHPQDYYEGAIVWTTKGWVMGSPFQARVLAADREKGSLTFAGQWGGAPTFKIIRGCQYYLEDKPQYLDSPGEFWFDKKGKGGRLYIRLPGDRDPNTARVEVAKRIHAIESRGMSHVHVSGLTFRFTNIYWNLMAAPYWVSHETIDVEPACVRLLGSGTDLVVSNCAFEHVHRGVRMKAMGKEDVIDRVLVSDNIFSDCDAGGIELSDGTIYGDLDGPMGRLFDVRVLRNMFDHVGIRPDLFGQGVTLEVDYAQTAEVAGNIFDRVCAQAVDVHGAKQSGASTNRPFTRLLIHHNKAVDTLLNNDDFGGIETWQGGPAYVFDNISGNPGGYRSWEHAMTPDTESRFGHAYYLDGAFKNYYFNNIAWGKSKGPTGKLANTSAFQEIISYQNTFFNNTVYNFVRASRRQAPQAGRNKFLGNIFQSMGASVFRDADPARTAAGNEADAGHRQNHFALETDAYARNVFYDVGLSQGFGVLEPSGRWIPTLEAFRDTLESYKPLASEVGVMAEQAPLRDAAGHDFRPSDHSAARGRGAKVFVPWSLYETVAEWNFCPIQGDPARILDEHWCMPAYYTARDNYYKFPTYPLKGINISLNDYQPGPLENWTAGALHFNGTDQYAVLSNQDIERPVTMIQGRGTRGQSRTISGAELANPQIHTSNFIIEIYFETAAGLTNASLIRKMGDAGWALGLNETGRVELTAKSGPVNASVASRSAVNDGNWHHVLAEADRKAGTFTIYIDGKPDSAGPGIGPDVSLANDADLFVGGTPRGHDLHGAIDFLRLARGTLADSKTTIGELYAWEFHGPFRADFTGHPRPADGGYAGAIDQGP